MLMRAKTVNDRIKVKRQMHRDALDEAFMKFEKFERRVDNLEGQLEAMDLGRESKPDLASEIEELANQDKIDAEMARLKAEMSGGNGGSDTPSAQSDKESS
jgi:phage shock protein A